MAPAPTPEEAQAQAQAKAVASLQHLGHLGDAIAAGTQASEAEGTDCERSFSGIQAMMTALEKASPGQQVPMPGRAAFMEVCQSLPVELRRCMVMSYAMTHRPECQAARRANPEADAKLQALVNLR
jgi:hypothetical protein